MLAKWWRIVSDSSREEEVRAIARLPQVFLAGAQRGVGGPFVERGRHHVGERVEQVALFAQERPFGRRRLLFEIRDFQCAPDAVARRRQRDAGARGATHVNETRADLGLQVHA